MRSIVIVLTALCLPTFALAQDRKPPEVIDIRVGFQTYQKDEQTAYKVGLWTPIHVKLFGGTDGIKTRGGVVPYIDIETVDSEDVGTSIRVYVDVNPNAEQTITGYVKTGRMGRSSNEIRVTLHPGKLAPKTIEHFWSLDIDAHLYLTIGAKSIDLDRAVRLMEKRPDGKDDDDARFDPNRFRHTVFENTVERLPEAWYGYNSVDMVILATGDDRFLIEFNRNPKRLAALAQWVRRGGRLVVPIAHENLPSVSALLRSPAWDPPIPVVPPGDAAALNLKTVNVAQWGAAQDHPFERADPRKEKIPVALLDPGKVSPGDWTVLAESGPESGRRPLITQVRYGLGQITYMAFSFEDTHFFNWAGKEKFLQTMVHKLAPKAPGNVRDMDRFARRGNDNNDLATEMLGMLDNFDVKVIPFGYVALFIVLYILVVGPLDFVLLKYVFKRLEWTWITFPSVVVGVSVAAYFAAFALKGRDLKVNKVDIVDFDMRTSADGKPVHAYGHSFFTILSPRIQNYTIGVEPNPQFWGAEARSVKLPNGSVKDEVLSVDLLSWMGRPSGGPHDMGRPGSTNFFRKPYTFREDAAGVKGVPIPVWTTKAFSASWEQTLKNPPFVANLKYHTEAVRGRDLWIEGTIENHLAVDLIDVWLIYNDRCFAIPGGLKSVKNGKSDKIALERPAAEDIGNWVNAKDARAEANEPRAWSSDPTSLVKRILFHERVDTQNVVRNHLLRPLDLGWRIQEEPREKAAERRTREAILFARVRHVSGAGEAVTSNADLPLPTKLWLGDLPETGKTRRALDGQLNQDTYVRVILPVRPADE